MDEQTETRICSNPACEFQGKPQPLDKVHFAEQPHYSHGFKTRCRVCDRKARRDRYSRKKKDELAYNKRWVATNRPKRNDYLKKRNRTIMDVYHNATKTEAPAP